MIVFITMISIKATVSELEKLEKLRSGMLATYQGALRHMRQYAVEVDAETLERHQRNLDAITSRVNSQLEAPALLDIDASLRCELRAYHDACAAFLQRLRKEFSENACVLQGLTTAMTETDMDGGLRLTSELNNLHALADSIEIRPISQAVRGAAARLQKCVDEIDKQHQYRFMQLAAEVQTLQKHVDKLRSNLRSRDEDLSMYGRFETESKIEGYLTGGQTFSIIALSLRNLRLIKAQHGESIGIEILTAFAKRLKNRLDGDVCVGQWAEQQVAVVLPVGKTSAISKSKDLINAVTGTYTHPNSGNIRRPELQVESAVMECTAGESMTTVLSRLQKLWEVMG